MPSKVPPHYDDNTGGALWRVTPGVNGWYRIGNAAPSRDQHCRWLDGESDPHAVYDSGDLLVHGPPAIARQAAQGRQTPQEARAAATNCRLGIAAQLNS